MVKLDDQIVLRISGDDRTLIRVAAETAGMTVAGFVRSAAVERALRALDVETREGPDGTR